MGSKKQLKNPPGTKELLIWGVPKKLKAKFKAVCAAKGSTMTAEILKFLRRFTANA